MIWSMQMKGRCMHISNRIWIGVSLHMFRITITFVWCFTMGETHRWGTFAKMQGHTWLLLDLRLLILKKCPHFEGFITIPGTTSTSTTLNSILNNHHELKKKFNHTWSFQTFFRKFQNFTQKGIQSYKIYNTWDCMFSSKSIPTQH
jgi:hypothetical protein